EFVSEIDAPEVMDAPAKIDAPLEIDVLADFNMPEMDVPAIDAPAIDAPIEGAAPSLDFSVEMPVEPVQEEITAEPAFVLPETDAAMFDAPEYIPELKAEPEFVPELAPEPVSAPEAMPAVTPIEMIDVIHVPTVRSEQSSANDATGMQAAAGD